jgi:RND family efflux transporter MFP subunit
MKTILTRLIAVALVGAVAYGGWAFFLKGGQQKKGQVTYEEGDVTRESVRSFVTATGVIQPWKIVDVKSNVAGRIDRLAVDLGDRVKAGQLIALIDPTDTQTAFDQANFDRQAADARKKQAMASVDQQTQQAMARVASAEQSIASAMARLEEARRNLDVQPDLTTLSINQAAAAKASAEKALAQAREGKRTLEEQLEQVRDVTNPLNLRTAEANLSQARASMITAESEYQRQRGLMAQGFVARSDLEAAYARFATARSSVQTAEQRQKTIQRENELAIRELQARIAGAQFAIEEASARVLQADASLSLAGKNSYLNDIRRFEHQAAAAGLDQARAEKRAAEAELVAIQVREQDVTSAVAQIKRVQAAQRQARTNLNYTRIVAPRDGVVITKNVEEGTVVPSSRASIGSTNALLQIGDVSRLWVVCNVDETDISQVSEGQKVTINVDAYPSALCEGKVIRIDPQAKVEQNVTLIPVTVEIDSPDPRFKPLMNATCEFVVDEVPDVITVPNEALKERGEGVFYVQKLVNGKPEDVTVEPGLAGPDRTEIKNGLTEGEKVITKTIEPEQPRTNNPFAGPFGGRSSGSGRSSGGSSGGGRGR